MEISPTAAEIYDILMEQLLRAIRKYDPAYKEKMKQIVEIINEKLIDRNQFSAADVNRHLEFDAIKYLRNLVGRGHLETVGGGVFQRAAWPPPAALLEGEPIGLTYCIQRWFKYYLNQWITDAMRELEVKEGVYSLDSRRGNGGFTVAASARPSCRLAGSRRGSIVRSPLGRGPKGREIVRRLLTNRIKLSQEILDVTNSTAAHRAPVALHRGAHFHWAPAVRTQ